MSESKLATKQPRRGRRIVRSLAILAILLTVTLLAMPGIIAATIFAFTISWANFLYPMAFVYSNEEMVLTAGTVTTLILLVV